MTVTVPHGFRASGVASGLKTGGQLDVALVVNDGPADVAAAVFTANRCKANPVLWSEQVLTDGRARAVVLNSGGANCYTGPQGFQATHSAAERVAAALGLGAIDVAVCSTGPIGEQLRTDALTAGIEDAVTALSPDGGSVAAEAIRTTDTRSKQAVERGEGWSVGGIAEGAGMLVVLTTDADVEPATAERALRAATRTTFDRLGSDGCMSTNDTILLLCNGASGVVPAVDEFAEAVHAVCRDLARQLLADAEGAEHDIAIEVRGAASEDDAVEVGRAVARSTLVKRAVFGRDPNWGQVLAAVGTTSAEFDPTRLDVAFNGVWVCRDGQPAELRSGVDLTARAVDIVVDLKAGAEIATIWTNDLAGAYVTENSVYST